MCRCANEQVEDGFISVEGESKKQVLIIRNLTFLLIFAMPSLVSAAITHDFAAVPIEWDPIAGPVSFDSNGDGNNDFIIKVDVGFIDPVSGNYVIDNFSTSSGGIEKTFQFSVQSLDPACENCEFNLLGFDFYSQKTVEPGGKGGAGNVGVDLMDDSGNELVNGVNVTGSLGSSPTSIVLPPSVSTDYFVLRVDTGNPPNNDDAQVLLGNFVFNSGTVTCSSVSAVPEPSMFIVILVLAAVAVARLRGQCLRQ